MTEEVIKYAGMKLSLDGSKEFVESMQHLSQSTTIAYEKLKQFRYLQQSSGGALGPHIQAQNQLTLAFENQQKALKTLELEYKKYRSAGDDKNADKLQLLLEKQRTSLEKTRKNIRQEIIGVEKLKNASYQSGVAAEEMGLKWEESGRRIAKAGAALSLTITKPIFDAFKASSDAAVEFESHMADVQKVTNMNDAETQRLANSFREMAKTIPTTTSQLTEIAEAGGRLFKTSGELREFTRVMADLSNTTNIVGEENVDTFVQFGKIIGLTAKEYKNLGSSVVELGNNFATNESDIMLMSNRIASAGKAARLTGPEITGIGTAMAQLGLRADRGGTSFSKLMMMISKETATGGKRVKDFANVAGMSAEQFTQAWRNDPMSALQALFDGLGGIYKSGKDLVPVLETLGIKEMRLSDTVRLLSIGHETLRDAVSQSNKAWKDATALQHEAAIRYSTSKSQLQIRKNRIHDVAITIGEKLVPYLLKLVEAGANIVETFTKLSPGTQDMIIKFAALAAAVGPVETVFGGVKNVVGGLIANFGEVSKRNALLNEVLPETAKKMHELGEAEESISSGAKTASGALGGIPAMLVGHAGIVAAVGAAIAALGIFYHDLTVKSEDVKKVIEDNNAMKKSLDELDLSLDTKSSGAGIMAERLIELSNVVSPTNEQINLMKVYVAKLNDEVPGLNLAFNNTTKSINMTGDQLRKFVDNMLLLEKQKVIVEKLGDAFDKVADFDIKAAEKKQQLEELDGAYQQLEKSLEGTGVSAEAFIRNHDKFFGQSVKLTGEKAKQVEDAYKDFSRLSNDAISESGRWINSYANKYKYSRYLLKSEIKDIENESKDAQETLERREGAIGSTLEQINQKTSGFAQDVKQANGEAGESYNGLAESAKQGLDKISQSEKENSEEIKKAKEEFNKSLEEQQRKIGDWTSGAVKENKLSIDELRKNLQEATNQFTEWHENMMKLSDRLPKQIIDKLTEMGPAYSDTIASLANMSDEQLQPVLLDMVAYFHSNIQAAIEEMGYLPDSQYASYMEMLKAAEDMGVKIPQSYYDIADRAVKSYSDRIGEIPTSADKTMGDANSNVSKRAKEAEAKMGYAARKVKGLFDEEYNAGKEAIGNTAKAGSEKIKEAADQTQKNAETLKKNVSKTFKDLKTDGEKTFGEMPGAFSKAFDSKRSSVENSAKSMAKLTHNGLKSQDTAIYRSGQHTAQGAINGVRSRISQAWSAGASIARAVNRGYNQTIEVHSPSRVMARSGEYTVEGVIVGIKNRMRDAYNATKELAETVVNGFNVSDIQRKFPSIDVPAYGYQYPPEMYPIPLEMNKKPTTTTNIYVQYYGKSESEREQFGRLWDFINDQFKREQSGLGGLA